MTEAAIEAPAWLLDALGGKPRSITPTNGDSPFSAPDNSGAPNDHWWLDGAIPAGQRHAAIAAVAGWGLRAGISRADIDPTVRDVMSRFEGDKYTWGQVTSKVDDIYGRYEAGDPKMNGVEGGKAEDANSLTPIDLTDAVNGTGVDPPTLMRRTDGLCLLYSGRVHWFQGESEACKSWALQVVVANVLKAGVDALYLDYEDDERGVVNRLKALGVDGELILHHLVYVRPDEPFTDHARLAPLLDRPYGVCGLDGVTEAMTTEGLSYLDNTDIAAWMRLVPKYLAHETGAPVVCLDHLTKNRDTQGRYAIGGQHKLAGVTGAAYKFELIRPLARATDEPVEGVVSITVEKDRPGFVRGRALGGRVATLTLVSTADGAVMPRLDPPNAEAEIDWQLGWKILKFIATYEAASTTRIINAVEGQSKRIQDTLSYLVSEGYASLGRKGPAHLHTITDKGREQLP